MMEKVKEERSPMKKKKQQRKRGIAEEIQVSILSKVVIVFVIVAAVVTFMVGNISLSAQKNDLEMQSKAAAYQLEIFFEEYTTVAEQMALNTDVQTLLEETGPGANITESERYATVFNTMKKTAAADSDNIQAVWVGDIDANVLTQSDGYTSGSDFEITERAWYKAVEEEKTILTDAYVDASTGNVILSAATPVYDQSGQNIIGVAGVDVALDHIDEVIKIIRGSANVQAAKAQLMERFDLSDAQAQAIVDMRLRALTGLEREKLENEYKELEAKIAELKAILADEKKLLCVIKEEISLIADKYGDDRRTAIGYDEYDMSAEDLIPDDDIVVTMTNFGYIKRMSSDNFKSQNRGGKGIKGMQTIEEDYIEDLLMTTTHHYVMFFTNKGRVYRLKGYEIPEAGRTARGTAIVNLLPLMPGEKITSIVPMKEIDDEKYLFMATRNGMVKKTPMKEYSNVRKNGLQAIVLRDDDELIEVKATDNTEDIFLITKKGMCIRFHETDVRVTGRVSMGVIGMKFDEGDEVIGMQMASQGECLLVVSENGYGKRTPIDEFTAQNRGGKGVRCYKIIDKTGDLVGAKLVDNERKIMLITNEGIIIKMAVSDISIIGRNTSGVKLMSIDAESGIAVASIAKVRESDKDEDEEDEFLEEQDGEETESENTEE